MKKVIVYISLIGLIACSTTPQDVAKQEKKKVENQKIFGSKLNDYCGCVEKKLTQAAKNKLNDSLIEVAKQSCAEEFINLETNF